MKRASYLFDTHALLFWHNRVSVSRQFVEFFDRQQQNGTLYVSSITFWEIAFLVKKGKLAILDLHAWTNELQNITNLKVIEPSISEMIDSTLLPDHHTDPFDRLLIAQANQHNLVLVTQDRNIHSYQVKHCWK